MARFYGTVMGSAPSEASRVGSGTQGVVAHIRGWRIGGKVEAFDRDGKDVILLQLTGGSENDLTRETPWIEAVRDPKTGQTEITVRPGPEGKVIKW